MMKFEIILDEQTPETPIIDDVSKFIKTHNNEIKIFEEYAINQVNAIGLAANQCSLNGERFNLRMIAIKTEDKCIIAINPKIIKYHGIKLLKYEGCLTWKGKPGMTVKAYRNYLVDVEFYTPDGEFHKETYKGLRSQVWQHEINHINGVKENIVILFNEPAKENFGRNDKCPCNSGKKLKRCCLKDYNNWS